MRFLSKKCTLMFLIIVVIFSIVFLYHGRFVSYNNINALSVSASNCEDDDTVFNLHYENKVWTFRANEFKLNSKVFSIYSRINYYGRAGTKQDKIKLLNKLIKINIDPEIAFNYIYLGFNNKINKIQKNIEKTPKDAEIIINSKINIKNEIVGIKLDKYLFYNNLIKQYNTKNKIISVNIPIIKFNPNITGKTLKEYTYQRSEFSTSIATSSSGRKFNVRKALNAIHGTHLAKSEKFSFNKCVGKRTADKGYKNAKIILDGEFVEGVGGGVCQVSSTLYNAVLLAGLNVITSQKHSQRVSYVQAGFDAMVNYGTSDLVFENNTEGDIYILCKYTNSKITISIYGASLNGASYKLQNEITNPVSAGTAEIIHDTQGKYIDKVIYQDESFELKKARDGYTVKSYVIKCMKGVEVDRQLLRVDKYLPQHSVIVYGIKERENITDLFDIITNQVN